MARQLPGQGNNLDKIMIWDPKSLGINHGQVT